MKRRKRSGPLETTTHFYVGMPAPGSLRETILFRNRRKASNRLWSSGSGITSDDDFPAKHAIRPMSNVQSLWSLDFELWTVACRFTLIIFSLVICVDLRPSAVL